MHNFITNADLADVLIEKKIIGVDFGEKLDNDQREITLHLQGGPLNDGNEAVVIRAFTNNNFHEPSRLSFERIT